MKRSLADSRPWEAVTAVLEEAAIPFSAGSRARETAFDVEIGLSGPETVLYLDFYPAVAAAQFPAVARRVEARLPMGGQGGLVVRRLSLALLDACKARGLCVFDLDGNGYLRAPGVFIERHRPAKDPQRTPSAGTCFTAKASRVVRFLLARYPRDTKQAVLAKETGLSRGYVSILTSRLVSGGYVANPFGQLYLEQPDRLLDDWAAHYRFDRHRQLHFALSMNTYEEGLEKVSRQLAASQVRFAFTGWSGAYLRAAYASPSVVMAYVDRAPETLERMYPVEKQGNVMLLVPQDAGVFEPHNESALGPVASDAQVYLDLCRMPGRAPEQADALRHARLDFERIRNGR